MGIDIFGRGTFGGGGLNTHTALEVLRKIGTSAALFAPGWTLEEMAPHNRDLWERIERKFWTGADFIDLIEQTAGSWTIIKNGGNGWKLLDFEEGYLPSKGRSKAPKSAPYITSYDWCIRQYIFDLMMINFTEDELDEEPLIEASVYYCGTGPNFEDLYYLNILLLDKDKNILAEFHTGELVSSRSWKKVSKIFSGYGAGLRFISWEDGGRSAEQWAGHYGTKIDMPSLVITRHHKVGCIATHVDERPIPERIPFVTNFCVGVGHSFWLDGVEVLRGDWSTLSAQSVLPTYFDKILNGTANSIVAYLNFDQAFDGGSSLQLIFQNSITRSLQNSLGNSPSKLPSLRLFKTRFNMQKDIIISYTLLATDQQGELAFVLQCSDGYSIFLIPQTYRINSSDDGSEQWTNDVGTIIFSNDISVHSNGWETRTFVVPKRQQNSKTTITALDILQFHSLNQIMDFLAPQRLSSRVFSSLNLAPVSKYLIGQLKILERTPIDMPLVDKLHYEVHWNADSIISPNKIVDIVLRWSCHGEALYFNIFLDKRFIGRAYTTYYYIERFIIEPTTRECSLCVQVVNLAGLKENDLQKLPTVVLSFQR
jgi:hypothetical protein